MAVLDNLILDLRDQEVLDYFGRDQRPRNDTKRFKAAVDRHIEDLKMHSVSQRPEPGGLGDVTIVTGVREYFEVIEQGQVVQTIPLTMPVTQTLGVSADTTLAVTVRAKEHDIKQLFDAYDQATDGEIEDYAAAKAKELRIPPDTFALFFTPTLTLKSWTLNAGEEKWLQEYFLPLIEKGFELRGPLRREYIPNYQPPVPGGVIEVRAGTKERDIEEKVKEAAREEAKTNDCPEEKYERLKIASVSSAPEFKVEWQWALVNWGKCKFHFWKPVTKIRNNDMVLYVTITYLNADDRLKPIFLDCLKEAAVTAGVIGVVLQNYEAAKAAFKAVFWKLLKQKLKETLRCLLPDLRLVKETGEWRPL